MSEGDTLGTQVRAEDPDRWLATRLIGSPVARDEVGALYALYGEFRGIARRARQPLAGELRLAWWLDAIERTSRGGAAEHPALEALAPALRAGRLPLAPLERMIEARRRTPDLTAAIDDSERVALFDDTAGALMEAVARLLHPQASPSSVLNAGRAWGWSGLACTLGARDDEQGRAREQSCVALGLARGELRALPVASFPAVAYLVFTRDRMRGRRGGELNRRLRLLWAAARGRV